MIGPFGLSFVAHHHSFFPHFTKTGQAITPLRLLRDNKDRLDEVISDVYVPDMEAFKLLDLLGLEGVFLIFGCAVDKELLKVAKSFPMFWREAHCWTSCLDKTCLALLVQTWEDWEYIDHDKRKKMPKNLGDIWMLAVLYNTT
ncbi:uncharacterized protein [Typha latifolia]|uniref:uncharacterized protein isoform X2 n=1 Tax=Typha latifolia TaxID=4733 RepID=UPI003C2AFF0E